MPTIERARKIKQHMGGSIYWDIAHQCYRVISIHSTSLSRYCDNYVKVE